MAGDFETPSPSRKIGDPADNAAGVNHRAGYSADKLADAERRARLGYSMMAGEARPLVEELDRLRAALRELREAAGAVVDHWKAVRS